MKVKDELTRMGRLAFREEGANWVAYYAMEGTMNGAIFLGAIKMTLISTSPQRKKQFMTLMRECFADVCQQVFGKRPQWRDLRKAPEHERSKNA